MISFRSRPLTTIDDVKREIVDVVERQRPGSRQDLTLKRDEVDALLASFSEFLPEWRSTSAVFRVARLDVGEGYVNETPWHFRAGVVTVLDNTVLPDVKHELPMVVEMLNFIRQKKGLGEIKMPLFLQPDELAHATASRAQETHEEPEEEVWAPRPSPAEPEPVRVTPRGLFGRRRGRRLKREQLRRAVHDRDGWRCRDCGEALDLHLHRVDAGPADDDPEGYVTLCRPCLLRAQGGGLRLGEAPTARGFDLGDESALEDVAIRSQLAVVFRKGEISWIGFVFGKRFVLLQA